MTQIQFCFSDPVVISATIQEFDGTRYYLCGKYFQRKGARLHLAVWKFHHGPVPEGYHIHHKDNDRSNNNLDNLECLTIAEHLGGKHGQESGERARKHIDKARIAAAAWHRSADGRAWHAEHYDKHVRQTMERRVSSVCQECGRNYLAYAIRLAGCKFCSAACKARALRKRRKQA
jgi:hypothetical protein